MKREKKYLWEILVPVNHKSVEIPIAYHQLWDEKVREIAGGLTIYKQTKGIWVSPEGRKYNDAMIPVRVYCTKEQLQKILDITLEHYTAEMVILGYRVSDMVVMKTRIERK